MVKQCSIDCTDFLTLLQLFTENYLQCQTECIHYLWHSETMVKWCLRFVAAKLSVSSIDCIDFLTFQNFLRKTICSVKLSVHIKFCAIGFSAECKCQLSESAVLLVLSRATNATTLHW